MWLTLGVQTGARKRRQETNERADCGESMSAKRKLFNTIHAICITITCHAMCANAERANSWIPGKIRSPPVFLKKRTFLPPRQCHPVNMSMRPGATASRPLPPCAHCREGVHASAPRNPVCIGNGGNAMVALTPWSANTPRRIAHSAPGESEAGAIPSKETSSCGPPSSSNIPSTKRSVKNTPRCGRGRATLEHPTTHRWHEHRSAADTARLARRGAHPLRRHRGGEAWDVHHEPRAQHSSKLTAHPPYTLSPPDGV